MTSPLPYTPFAPGQGLRMFYTSTCQVLRAAETVMPGGGVAITWPAVSTIVDPQLSQPGLLQCRLDLTFVRPGKDQPAPLVAGRAPDRTGVCYFDAASDPVTGVPYVLAGDRLLCVAGPIYGTFEIRPIPDVAQDLKGAHHIEVQVIEVSQMITGGSPQPFPGNGGP